MPRTRLAAACPSASAIATERCRPPVQPIAIVRYVFPSAMYCGIRNRSSAVVSCRKRRAAGARRTYRATRGLRPRPAAAAPCTKCGFGRNRTSNTRSASGGTPRRNPKLSDVDQRAARPSPVPPVDSRIAAPQLVHVQPARVDDLVRQPAQRLQQPPLLARCPRPPTAPAPSGCGRRVSLNRRSSDASVASRNTSRDAPARPALQLPVDARETAQLLALADVDDDGRAPDLALRRRASDRRTSESARPAGCRRRSSRGPRARGSRATCPRRTGR